MGNDAYEDAAAIAAPSPPDVRVLVIDGNAYIRDALAELMEVVPGLTAVGAVATGGEGVDAAARLCPDAVLVDSRMRDMSGADTIRKIRAVYPQTHVIGFSLRREPEVRQALLDAGADAFVCKDEGITELVRVVRALGLAPEASRRECEERGAGA